MNNIKIPTSPPKEDTMEGRLIKLLSNYICDGENYVFPDGTLFHADVDCECSNFLDEYNTLDIWRLPTLEGIPPYLTSNTEEKEKEEYASCYYAYYLLDFYEHFESSKQVCYSILTVGFIEVGGSITIDENIPTDFLDRWLINALDKNWEATPDDDDAWGELP